MEVSTIDMKQSCVDYTEKIKSGMKLTVIGCNGPYPAAGGACSGYLLEADESKILIDMGSGVLSKLYGYVEPHSLDAIILTHLHSDHMSDVLVYRYLIQLALKKGRRKNPVKVYGPSSPTPEADILRNSEQFINYQIINDKSCFKIGAVEFSFLKGIHPVESYAVKMKHNDGNRRTFLYTGDTAYNESMEDFAKDADILLADSCFLHETMPPSPPHMSARQCGELARRARAGKLIITHFTPEGDMTEKSLLYENHLTEAKRYFENTSTAYPGLVII